jgi:hypothetical protein
MAKTAEVISWVKGKESVFLTQLERLERKWDTAEILKPRRHFFRYEPKKVFDGAGLCEVATSALGLGMAHAFHDEVKLSGSYMIVPKFGISHAVLRVVTEDGRQTFDATHRQIFKTSKPIILTMPVDRESEIYQSKTQTQYELPKFVEGAKDKIIKDVFTSVTLDDFEELVAVLK